MSTFLRSFIVNPEITPKDKDENRLTQIHQPHNLISVHTPKDACIRPDNLFLMQVPDLFFIPFVQYLFSFFFCGKNMLDNHVHVVSL